MELSRLDLIEHLARVLETKPWIDAAWLGGSDAFGSADDMSDVDLNLDVADGRATDALATVECALEALSPIVARVVVPEPAWHGHRQRFYRLRDAPETVLVDVLVMERGSKAPRLDEREQHGEPIV